MNKKIKWGIIGIGKMADNFAAGFESLPEAELYAVASRSEMRSREFGEKYKVTKVYGNYESLIVDPEVEVVYIATLHPFHKELAIKCLMEKKAVLCEKPVTMNAEELVEILKCAKDNNVFFMDAMWIRFLPIIQKVKGEIDRGRIGEVRMLQADFGFRIDWNPEDRQLNKSLGGGARLDVGVYVTSFATLILGEKPNKVVGMSHIGETGVDEQTSFLLGYKKGQQAILSCACRTRTPSTATIMGTEGYIIIPDFWHGTEAMFYVNGQLEETISLPFERYACNYEAREVMKCLKEGKLESDIMPWKESLDVMEILDMVKEQ